MGAGQEWGEISYGMQQNAYNCTALSAYTAELAFAVSVH